MNTNLTTHTEAQIQDLKFSAMGEVYNTFATELGIKLVKKFRDKSTGIKRITDIQEQYIEEANEIKSAEAKELTEEIEAPKVAKAKGSRFDLTQIIKFTMDDPKALTPGTIEYSLCNAIVELEDGTKEDWSVTCQELVDFIIVNHKRPRSHQVVDKAYVIHNIKWFIKAGSIEIVE